MGNDRRMKFSVEVKRYCKPKLYTIITVENGLVKYEKNVMMLVLDIIWVVRILRKIVWDMRKEMRGDGEL